MEPGPSSLLLDARAVERLEQATGYTLLWTFLGEKIVLGGSRTDNGYAGRLMFGGACRLSKGKLVGRLLAKFYGPGEAWDQ